MVNKSKAKGTSAESAFVKYAQANGFPDAMRPALHGSADKGDVWLTQQHAVIVECKNYRAPASVGQPAAKQLDEWMAQTRDERANAGARFAFLVVKRSGTTDVGRWFAYVQTAGLFYLAGVRPPIVTRTSVACLTVADVLSMVRASHLHTV